MGKHTAFELEGLLECIWFKSHFSEEIPLKEVACSFRAKPQLLGAQAALTRMAFWVRRSVLRCAAHPFPLFPIVPKGKGESDEK